MLSCANGPRVDYIANKDAAIANLARMSYLQNDLHRWIEEYVTTHNGNGDTFNNVCTILYAAIDSLLTTLTDAVNIVVFKPVDIG